MQRIREGGNLRAIIWCEGDILVILLNPNSDHKHDICQETNYFKLRMEVWDDQHPIMSFQVRAMSGWNTDQKDQYFHHDHQGLINRFNIN